MARLSITMSGNPHKNYAPTAEGRDNPSGDEGWQPFHPATSQLNSLCDFDDILTTTFYESAPCEMVPSGSNWTQGIGASVPTCDSGVLVQAAGLEQFQTGSIYHPSQNQYDGVSTYNQAPPHSVHRQQPSLAMNAGFDCLQTPSLSEGVHLQTGQFDGDSRLSHELLPTECTDNGDDFCRFLGINSPASSTPKGSGLSAHRRSPGALCNPLAPAGAKISRPRWKKPRVPGSRKSDPRVKGEVVEIPHCTLERYSEYLAKTKLSGPLPTPEELQYRANRQKYRVRELKGFIAWAAAESGHTNEVKGTICWECFEYTGKFHPRRQRNDDAACRCERVTQATLSKFADTAKVGQLCFPIHEFEKTTDML
jgi:hypothetical protein